jgi:hypothetical protein
MSVFQCFSMDPYSAACTSDSGNETVKTFSCSLCPFKSSYTYFGRKPPSVKSCMVLLEDAYIIKNPFVDPRRADKSVTRKPIHPVLVLGSHCSICEATVCVAIECSYFYTKRFCKNCMSKHLQHFPEQVQKEFTKNISAKNSK